MSDHPPHTQVLTDDDRPTLEIAQLGGRFTAGAGLGAGGMGDVRLAVDRELDREVALKRLGDGAPASLVRLLVSEARLQGRLDHPAIPPVYDVGIDDDGRPAFAMRRVGGVTLGAWLAATGIAPASLEARVRVFVAVCRAIDHAHQRGVAHCDLKPGNVMVDDDERVYVIDWGVATSFGDDQAPPRRAGGTLGYMAPEQLDPAAPLDGRADVFALGCLLFELLAGEPLYPRGPDLLDDVMRGRRDRRPSRRAPTREIPAALDRACERATARLPAERHAHAGALADEVEAWLDRSREAFVQAERARAHQARAEALAADPATRDRALTEAGRALALAPDDAATAALVRRLIAADDVPPAARADLDALEAADDRRLGRAAVLSHLGFLLFPLALWLEGHADRAVIGIIVAAWAGLEALAIAAARGRGPRWWPHASLVLLAGQATLYARFLGPFTITPAIAALAAAGALMHPRLRRPVAVIAVLLVPIGLPVLGEAVGWWPSTLGFDHGALVLRSTASALRPTATTVGLAAIAFAVQVVGALIGAMVATPAHQARRQLAVQAWHLEQLMPSEPRGRPR